MLRPRAGRSSSDRAAPITRAGLGAARGVFPRALGVVGLAGILVSGLLISVGAAHTDSLLPESVRPMPNWLAGPFGSTGFGLGVGGLIAAFVLMFACYVLAVRESERLAAANGPDDDRRASRGGPARATIAVD